MPKPKTRTYCLKTKEALVLPGHLIRVDTAVKGAVVLSVTSLGDKIRGVSYDTIIIDDPEGPHAEEE